jgi:hypothetical protein
MKTFLDLSQPRDVEVESEGEKRIAELKERLIWFYQHGVQVTIKPNRYGFALVLQTPQAVIVGEKR